MVRHITRYTTSGFQATTDELVEEAPVEFRLNGVPIAVLMRTPGDDENLGLGFALTEGIVLNPGEVAAVRRVDGSQEGDRNDIVLSEGVEIDPEQFRRNLYTSSSCGVCGKASIDAVRVTARAIPAGPRADPHIVPCGHAILSGHVRTDRQYPCGSGIRTPGRARRDRGGYRATQCRRQARWTSLSR